MKRITTTLLLVFCTICCYAIGDNIAPEARIKTSSTLSEEFAGEKAIDGKIRLYDQGEWRSMSGMTSWGEIDYPWIQLNWEAPKAVNRVVLYDRPTQESHTAGGILHFSDGSKILVHQIPNDGSPKTVNFPTKRTDWIKFEVTDADGIHAGLSEIEVYTAEESLADYVAKVDPFIESARGRYFFFVTGSQPFGMISAAPLTRNKNQYGGGYNYNSTEVLGFPQIHCWMLSGVNLMPTTGKVDAGKGEQGWKSNFSHDGEITQPGYHRLYLDRYKMWVEQTASDRVSFYRMTYTDRETTLANILVSLGGYISTSTMTDADVRKVNDREIEGSVSTVGRFWGGPDNVRIHYVVRFEKPMTQMNGWDNGKTYQDIKELRSTGEAAPRQPGGWSYWDAPPAGVSAQYELNSGDVIQMKVAVSYTSVENARRNLDSEDLHWDFDQARQTSRDEWNEYLGRIDVKGGTPDQQTKFYTDLWHVLLGRHKLDDVSGDYPDYTDGERQGSHTININYKTRTLPKGKDGRSLFHMYNSDAFWLTQWNLNVLWGLAWPEVLDDFAACLIQYAENGGLLPRGPNAGGYSYIMTTCPATPLLVSAYQKSVLTKKTPQAAYTAMVRNHKGGGMMGTPKQIENYEKLGYFPGNAGLTVEASFQDWALSQMAEKMGKKKEARFYKQRSEGWQKLYNDEQKLLFPKKADGSWSHTDPLSGDGWIEANAWQATWCISHDIPRLSALMGGNEVLCEKLNYAFEQARNEDFVYGYSNGYVSYANQPGCSNAHVFNYAGAPHLSQYWVRRVNEQAYGWTTPDKGYGGHDEDQGQMGGISALMSMGLFSLKGTCDTDPVYEITSPVFDEITIKLSDKYYSGETFRIKTYNNSAENCYIRQSKLNGQPLDTFWFRHEDFARGGLLELWLDSSYQK